MNPSSEDIKDYLISSAVGVGEFNATSGWSIHINEAPDSPNTIILIQDSPGGSPNPNYSYEYPSLQIQVRGNLNGYLSAYAKAEEIKNVLNGLTNETLNGARYIQILCIGDINPVGKDEKGRDLFTLNFDVQRTSTT